MMMNVVAVVVTVVMIVLQERPLVATAAMMITMVLLTAVLLTATIWMTTMWTTVTTVTMGMTLATHAPMMPPLGQLCVAQHLIV